MALRVEVLAVGQGMCNLVVGDNGLDMNDPNYEVNFLGLIDAGSEGGLYERAGKLLIDKIRWLMNKRADIFNSKSDNLPIKYYIDFVLLSHLDSDHCNFIQEIFKDTKYLNGKTKFTKKDSILHKNYAEFVSYDARETIRNYENDLYKCVQSFFCHHANKGINYKIKYDNELSFDEELDFLRKVSIKNNTLYCLTICFAKVLGHFILKEVSFSDQVSDDNTIKIEINLSIQLNKIKEKDMLKFDIGMYNNAVAVYKIEFEKEFKFFAKEDPLVSFTFFMENIIALLKGKEEKRKYARFIKLCEEFSKFVPKIFEENYFKNLFKYDISQMDKMIDAGDPCVIGKAYIGGISSVIDTNTGILSDVANASINILKSLTDSTDFNHTLNKNSAKKFIKIDEKSLDFFVYNYEDNFSLNARHEQSSENTASLVCSLRYDDKVIAVFNGDATNFTMNWIEKNCSEDKKIYLQYPVFMTAPHHGAYETAKEFDGKLIVCGNYLKFISPDRIVISAAHDSKFGHPQYSICWSYQNYLVSKGYFDNNIHALFYNVTDSGNNGTGKTNFMNDNETLGNGWKMIDGEVYPTSMAIGNANTKLYSTSGTAYEGGRFRQLNYIYNAEVENFTIEDAFKDEIDDIVQDKTYFFRNNEFIAPSPAPQPSQPPPAPPPSDSTDPSSLPFNLELTDADFLA